MSAESINPDLEAERARYDGFLASIMLGVMMVTLATAAFAHHAVYTLGLALLVPALPVWLARVQPGSALTCSAIAIGLMLQSAVLVDASYGLVEAHFSYFVLLPIPAGLCRLAADRAGDRGGCRADCRQRAGRRGGSGKAWRISPRL